MADHPAPSLPADLELREREPLTNEALNALYRAAWHGHVDRDFEPVHARSLTWFTVRRDEALVGYVNVAWDGALHAFLLDPTVRPDRRGLGLGRTLVRAAIDAAGRSGVHWLHVDFEDHLTDFYLGAGFRPTRAGIVYFRPPAAP